MSTKVWVAPETANTAVASRPRCANCRYWQTLTGSASGQCTLPAIARLMGGDPVDFLWHSPVWTGPNFFCAAFAAGGD